MLDSLDTLIAFALIFTIVSLLITIGVQMITSLSNLRGKNLAWGIAEAFEAIAPELKAEVKGKGKTLADHLLNDALISDSQCWRIKGAASAVRPDELFDLLHRIATNKKPGTPDEIKQDVVTLFRNLGVPASVFELVENEKQQLENLRADITTQLAALPDGPAKEQLQKVKTETEAKLANVAGYAADVAIRWAAQGEKEIKKVYEKFEHWFETRQERSQEWFTTHARIITGILGLAAAFVLQLDTIEIYKLVSSNRAVRDSLVAQTKNVLEQGEKVFKDRPTVLQTALNGISATGGKNASLTNVSISIVDTVGTVKLKIREASTNSSPEEVDKLLEGFDQQISNVVKTNLNGYRVEYNSVVKSLDKTGFDLFPKGGSLALS
jgi:hypothetical protein